MESLGAYIPIDRRQVMTKGQGLPNRTQGAALFADISGFTPLTEALVQALGDRHGADELTRQLNRVYEALIAPVHRYRGSVVGFSGDGITCWFDGGPLANSAQQQAALRAVACALAMQEAMGQFVNVAIPAGPTISLTMKAGIASGPVRRFLVGDPGIQTIDVLAGATLRRMAEAERVAQQDEVLVEAETVRQLGEQVIVRWPGAQRRFAVVTGLAYPVAMTPWSLQSSLVLTEERMRPWLLSAVYERLRAGQDRFLAEIHPAVALFLSFDGPDYDEDDAADEKLDAYVRWVQRVVSRYKGYLFQLTVGEKGNYLYIAFGAPRVHDDDPVRAVAAALELRSPPPALNFVTNVRIGISQGRMRIGAYGSSTRRTYGALGDEVNVAARLMEMAESGLIVMSKRVADATARYYHSKALGSVPLKGKQALEPIFAVLGRRLLAPSFTNPLVERDAELVQMEEVLASAWAGEGRILRLEGVAGVGKSHLAAEFAQRAMSRGFRVALGACQSISQDIAYSSWRQVFRTLFGLTNEPFEENLASWADQQQQIAQVEARVKDINSDWRLRLPLLGDLLGLPIPDNMTTAALDPQSRQQALFAAAVEMVQIWAQSQPLLLLLEDAHWMDEASLGLTLALGRAIAHVPVLLALVHRPPAREDQPLFPDLDHRSCCHHLNLRELSPWGIAALATNRLQGELSALALGLIQAQAQGNPFFTEELVNTLRESGRLCRQEDGTWTLSGAMFNTLRGANCLVRDTLRRRWMLAPNAPLSAVDLDIPDTVHGVVLSRLDRLPEKHILTLKVASVIGRVFEFDLLAQAHPLDPDREVLQRQMQVLEERDFVRLETPSPRLTYIFKHNITQEVTYETLLEAQRRELHQAVGQALEGLHPEAVERLAYHYSRSGVRDKTLFYLDKAARKAQREYANETALNYYNQALALEERWGWCKGQVEVAHILGRREDELAGLKALEAASGAPAFDVAFLKGAYYEAVGDFAQAQTAVERAWVTSRDQGDLVGQMRCLAQLGVIAGRQGEFGKAEEYYTQALALLPVAETGSDEEVQVLVEAFNGLGIVCAQQARYDWARRCWERVLALSQTSGNRVAEAQACSNLGGVAFHQRDFDRALTHYREALEIRRAIGDWAGEGTTLSNIGQVFRDAGDYAQALAYLAEARAVHQATGNRWMEANVLNDFGGLYLFVGDLEAAREHLEEAQKLCQALGDEAGEAYVLSNLGQVAYEGGDLDEAERLLSKALNWAQGQGDQYLGSFCFSHLGIVSLAGGRLNQAIDRAKTALEMRREKDLRQWMTADLATLAEAHLVRGDTEQALTYAHQAKSILDERHGEGAELPQRDYFVCYRVFCAGGEHEAAHDALESAYNLVMERAVKISDPALRESFLRRVRINREIVQTYADAKDGLCET